MQRFFRRFLLVALTCFARAAAADDAPLFDVPQLSGVHVDGNPDDWQSAGFRVGMLFSSETPMPSASDLNADFRLGWDAEGLLLLLTVQDETATETPNLSSLWESDSVELFRATRRGSSQYYQFILSPGIDPKFPELRQLFGDYRKGPEKQPELTVQAVRTRTSSGYILEARFPWANLGIQPASGDEIAFQLYVNDQDGSDARQQLLSAIVESLQSPAENLESRR